MDNITHTVIGAIAGETLARLLPANPMRRRLLPAIGMIGGNLPDLDLLYSYRPLGSELGPLTYLLEHRGYTHTLVGCLLLALVLYPGALLYARRLGAILDRHDHILFLGWSVGATFLHLGMDALNSYGVHPFWPFDDHWYYGDSVFIIEPLYWIAAAPLLYVFKSRPAKLLLVLLLVAGVAASELSGLVPLPAMALLCTLCLVLLVAGRTSSPRRAAAFSAGTFLVITAVFMAAGQMAHARIRQAAFLDFPGEQLLDVALSPMPADPLCWDALVLSVDKDLYLARRTTLALAPALIAADNCRDRDMHTTTTAHWSDIPAADAGLPWREYSMPIAALLEIVHRHCQAAALMQFARAPFIEQEQDGETEILGDLRFDREKGPGLTKMRFPRPGSEVCPSPVPWIAPREILLGDR